MSELSFVASESRVAVETRAKGMLAKLAHDLSVVAKEVTATASVDGACKVRLAAAVSSLTVEGTLKGNDLDTSALSTSDRSEIQKKIREEVLPTREVVVTMEAPGGLGEPGRRSVEATGKIEVGSRSAKVSSRCSIEVEEARVVASGRVKVNLPALGITPPKGPLGAFRVTDDVEVVFKLVFTR